jgi:AcrR family transcriptional regulator
MPKMKTTRPREPLSKERIVRAAVALADETGWRAFSMRRLAAEFDVVPMALYKHVANKEDLLDGMLDLVFDELHDPVAAQDWKAELRLRAISLRQALNRHPWAIPRMQGRKRPGPATMRHHNAMLGCLRQAGFSFEMTVHAYSVQDSYIYGFALQEMTLPFETPEESGELVQRQVEAVGGVDEYPYLLELQANLAESGYEFETEFEWGLDRVLASLEGEHTER